MTRLLAGPTTKGGHDSFRASVTARQQFTDAGGTTIFRMRTICAGQSMRAAPAQFTSRCRPLCNAKGGGQSNDAVYFPVARSSKYM